MCLLGFWRLLQVNLWGAINERMTYRFSQPIHRTGSFHEIRDFVFTYSISGYRDLHSWLLVWFFVLVWFFNQFFVKVITRLLVGRLKDSSELMKDQENMVVTHFPLFRTFIHKTIKPFNHKIKSLDSIPCSEKMKLEHNLTVNTLINLFSGPWNFIFFNCHSLFNFIFYTATASLYRMETSFCLDGLIATLRCGFIAPYSEEGQETRSSTSVW